MSGVFKITTMLIKFYKHKLEEWNNYYSVKCGACGNKATANIVKHEVYNKEDNPNYKEPKILFIQICQVCDERNCFEYLKLKYC